MTMIHPTIETLRRLRLTGMAKALEEQQSLSDCDRLSFDERLAMLVDREAVERDNVALAQRLRLARLRQAACLEDHEVLAAARRQLAGSGLIGERLAEPSHGAVEMMQLKGLSALDPVVGSDRKSV